MRQDHALTQIGDEPLKRVTQPFSLLAHNGGSGNHSQGVERYRRTISIRISEQFRCKYAIVDSHTHDVVHRIAHFDWDQVVNGVYKGGDIAEGIAETLRQKEMRPRLLQFLDKIVSYLERKIDSPRTDPT